MMFRKTAIALGLAGMGLAAASQLQVGSALPEMSGDTPHILAPVVVTSGPATDPGWLTAIGQDPFFDPQGDILDVSISNMYGLTSYGHIGSYPNGRNGFSTATTSCNVGTVDVPWFAAMDPRHPFIGQNVYRINAEGRLDQIGLAWLKHGWYAADSYDCGSCPDPDYGDDHLNLQCSDTYNASHNADRSWLGPRSEVDPQTGIWDPCDSHFDGGNDCRRSHNSGDHDAIEHRLRVFDADLAESGASFLYEGFYVVKDDMFPMNNFTWRDCSFSWSGSSWRVNDTSNLKPGPLVAYWGDYTNFASPRSEGTAIVSVRVVDAGGGNYRYEYAVMNYDIDRGVSAFRVPVGAGAQVGGIGFSAPLEDEEGFDTADWNVDVSGGYVTWYTDDFSQNEFANTIRFGTMYSFWFTSDTAPELTTAELAYHRSGTNPGMAVSTVGPGGGVQSGFLLEVSALRRQQDGQFLASGLDAGEKVYFLYSEEGMGETYVPVLDLKLDMRMPIVKVLAFTADGNGEALVNFRVPLSAPSGWVAIQAVVRRPGGTSLKSNVVNREVTN